SQLLRHTHQHRRQGTHHERCNNTGPHDLLLSLERDGLSTRPPLSPPVLAPSGAPAIGGSRKWLPTLALVGSPTSSLLLRLSTRKQGKARAMPALFDDRGSLFSRRLGLGGLTRVVLVLVSRAPRSTRPSPVGRADSAAWRHRRDSSPTASAAGASR